MQSALYASGVYQQRRDADPYGASRFGSLKVRGELDQTVLQRTLRNISYRIPKSRQPCDDAQTPNKKLLLARSPMTRLARRSTGSKASS
ncbi:jg4922 [Pararge aegeria aegeria]|uniref:Jg4922 protein n=1 Tax=Pararge aegeria aegeria TaxID=348720 RepID=A0A8S4SIE6_9NEOP|nr:jg4922 [Pararge aegeria aegeria]